jgi:hypothetical protein
MEEVEKHQEHGCYGEFVERRKLEEVRRCRWKKKHRLDKDKPHSCLSQATE